MNQNAKRDSLELESKADVPFVDPKLHSVAAQPSVDQPWTIAKIEAELSLFEQEQKRELGIEEPKITHWFDANPQSFSPAQKNDTTLLFGGLTLAQDQFIQAAVQGLGYKVQCLETPSNRALHIGKEFGNRGQCNPTYFTVGNLLKYLFQLRDEQGMSVESICQQYVFVTAGACGPCRFGTYATEYRKALRDAGFDNFRVLLFQQQGGLKQANGQALGLEFNRAFFRALLSAVMVGDLLNLYRTRTRPYELTPGATDVALEQSRQIICHALSHQKSLLWALWRVRKMLQSVPVNYLQPKPKVMIIGEFWAMTTEGDGNYHLQDFLEKEGAECEVQMVVAWFLFNLWEHRWDLKKRLALRASDQAKAGLTGTLPYKKKCLLWAAEKGLGFSMAALAKLMGIKHFALPDMDLLASLAHDYYRNEIRGGEGHMEVGKLILAAKKHKAHMVISVKPFGCMPSASVSDGIQTLIVKQYPQVLFCPLETSGDGAVNFYSRIQMTLFKARQKAKQEFEQALQVRGKDAEALKLSASKQKSGNYPKHQVAGTAANLVLGGK